MDYERKKKNLLRCIYYLATRLHFIYCTIFPLLAYCDMMRELSGRFHFDEKIYYSFEHQVVFTLLLQFFNEKILFHPYIHTFFLSKVIRNTPLKFMTLNMVTLWLNWGVPSNGRTTNFKSLEKAFEHCLLYTSPNPRD